MHAGLKSIVLMTMNKFVQAMIDQGRLAKCYLSILCLDWHAPDSHRSFKIPNNSFVLSIQRHMLNVHDSDDGILQHSAFDLLPNTAQLAINLVHLFFELFLLVPLMPIHHLDWNLAIHRL